MVTRAALPLVLKSSHRTILTITSAGAFASMYVAPSSAPNTKSDNAKTCISVYVSPGGSAYQSTKTAQVRLNDFLMVEYGDKVSILSASGFQQRMQF